MLREDMFKVIEQVNTLANAKACNAAADPFGFCLDLLDLDLLEDDDERCAGWVFELTEAFAQTLAAAKGE